MKNVIIYSRVSTDEQAQQGYSLEYQEETIRRYCDHKGYTVLVAFVEDFSAKTFDRPKWKEIIKYIQKNKNSVEAIVILRWDRFSRNLINSFNEIATLRKLGVEIEAVEGQIDTSTPESLLIQAIALALPQIENDKISIRSMEGSHKARLNGCYTGPAPRGYKNVRFDKNSSLDFSADAPLIKEAFEKMASSLYSADEIRRWLSTQGINMTKNQFPSIIRNVTYTGKIFIRSFKGEPEQIVQGLHLPLVSDDVFARANDVLDGRRRKMNFKSDKSDLYPLKGHLVCPVHGRTLSAYKSKGRNDTYHYYVCTKPHVKCTRYPVQWAHTEIEKILAQVQFSAQVIVGYRSVLEGLFEVEDAGRKKAIHRLKDEIERLNKRKEFVQEQYMDGEINSTEYKELKFSIDTKIYEESKNLFDLNESTSPYREYLDKHVPMLEDVLTFYQNSNGKTKNKILGCIFSEKLHFENGKVAAPKFTTPIDVLIRASGVLGSNKMKKEVISDLLPTMAPEAGLEPATL